ncbi:MAG: hypothetical protein WC389_21065 [Lutibacter sp.]|jgi:hypothetical protein
MAPNIFIFDRYEADFIAVTNSGYIREFEIKLSLSDFYNDARKVNKYTQETKYDFLLSGKGPCEFYYMFPEGLIPKEKIPEWAGIANPLQVRYGKHGSYYDVWEYRIRRISKRLNKNKITDIQKNTIFRSLYHRYWDLQSKRIKEKNGEILML